MGRVFLASYCLEVYVGLVLLTSMEFKNQMEQRIKNQKISKNQKQKTKFRFRSWLFAPFGPFWILALCLIWCLSLNPHSTVEFPWSLAVALATAVLVLVDFGFWWSATFAACTAWFAAGVRA